MPPVRHLRAELAVDGDTISGVVVDEAGDAHPFEGWLGLIGILQAESPPPDGSPASPE